MDSPDVGRCIPTPPVMTWAVVCLAILAAATAIWRFLLAALPRLLQGGDRRPSQPSSLDSFSGRSVAVLQDEVNHVDSQGHRDAQGNDQLGGGRGYVDAGAIDDDVRMASGFVDDVATATTSPACRGAQSSRDTGQGETLNHDVVVVTLQLAFFSTVNAGPVADVLIRNRSGC